VYPASGPKKRGERVRVDEGEERVGMKLIICVLRADVSVTVTVRGWLNSRGCGRDQTKGPFGRELPVGKSDAGLHAGAAEREIFAEAASKTIPFLRE